MSTAQRLRLFDAIRGFSVVSMVLFHFCYDLSFLMGRTLPFFEPPLRDIWRASISWTFLAVAGSMCSFSRHNGRRAIRYGTVALLIFLGTSITAVDVPINFGIIFCMAGSTGLVWLLQRANAFHHHDAGTACLLAICFLVCLHLPEGYLTFGGFHLVLPRVLYASPWLSWLGFPSPGFSSGDYYPLLPFSLLYLAAAFYSSAVMARGGFPSWFSERGCRPLEFVGRHALVVYIAHQPLILLCLAPFMT